MNVPSSSSLRVLNTLQILEGGTLWSHKTLINDCCCSDRSFWERVVASSSSVGWCLWCKQLFVWRYHSFWFLRKTQSLIGQVWSVEGARWERFTYGSSLSFFRRCFLSADFFWIMVLFFDFEAMTSRPTRKQKCRTGTNFYHTICIYELVSTKWHVHIGTNDKIDITSNCTTTSLHTLHTLCSHIGRTNVVICKHWTNFICHGNAMCTPELGCLFLQESSGFLSFPFLWHFFHRNHDSCSAITFFNPLRNPVCMGPT